MRGLGTLILLLLVMPAALAQQDHTQTIANWYAALAKVDRNAFEAMISDKALIKLEDIGVVQTKAEFIESLEEWESAMKGATIRHQLIGQDGASASVHVCYSFTGNESINREDFRIEAGLVIESVQSKLADSCGGFGT